jgi:hypothetical protein
VRFNRFFRIFHLFLIFSLLINFHLVSFISFSPTTAQSETYTESFVEKTDFNDFILFFDQPTVTSYNYIESISFLYTGDQVNSFYVNENYYYTATDLFHNFNYSVRVTYLLSGLGQIIIAVNGLVVLGIQSYDSQPSRCFTYGYPTGSFHRYDGGTVPSEGSFYFQINWQDSILTTKILNKYNGSLLFNYTYPECTARFASTFSVGFSPSNTSTFYRAEFSDLYINYEYENISLTSPSNTKTNKLGYNSFLPLFFSSLSLCVLVISYRKKIKIKI